MQYLENAVALFPGQGSLSGGAGTAWMTTSSWSIVDEISDVTGVDVAHLLMNASDDDIVRTDRAQLATFALSLVGWNEVCLGGIVPRYLLGHSLGEFSALVASGLVSLVDGARLVATRGRAMLDAAQASSGTMVALMGGDDGAREALGKLSDVWIANINGPGQIVVSGTTTALDSLVANARELGWRRATPLRVGGAFHSPLMAPAQALLDDALDQVAWASTDFALVSNVDGAVHDEAGSWRDLLSRQLTSPVQFLDAVNTLADSVTTTIELPPAGVLTGLTKRIREFERQVSLVSPDDVKEVGA